MTPHPKHDSPSRRDCLRRLGALAAAGLAGGFAGSAAATTLAQVRSRGALIVGVYHEMPPFHVDGKGIDVDLAKALAEALGVKLNLLPFFDGENMNDDLRNMVWRGHYLGWGPADVLLHVPVDAPLMEANPQVEIFAPYWRDRVMIARRLSRLPRLDTFTPLTDAGALVAVPGESLAGLLLLGADGGAYRQQVRTAYKDGVEAANALLRDEVSAAAGLASELESVLQGDARFAITALPSPRAPREGWAVGMAVKRDATDLAQALQAAVNALAKNGRLQQIFAQAHVTWQAA